MPLIEAALAFAITMLALSLIVSSFVEVIHRAFKMREAGLKYMLEQLFDQVLVKYVKPLAEKAGEDAKKRLADNPTDKALKEALTKIVDDPLKAVRDSFVERMTANRSPVGLKADPRLAADVPAGAKKPGLQFGNIWGGRRVTQLTSADFMERLGSVAIGDEIRKRVAGPAPANAADAALKEVLAIDVAAEIKKVTDADAGKSQADATLDVLKDITQKVRAIDVNKEIAQAATKLGQTAADSVDTVLTDIAQKFDGFGKDAATYFEGRARFMSVMVAIVLAFVVHVDAIDLFKTYFRDPNARAKVIEQSQAVTAQYKAAQEAANATKALAKPDAPPTPEEAKKLEDEKKAADANKSDADKAAEKAKEQQEAKEKALAIKKQVEDLEKAAQEAVANAKATVKQYADLGVPIGWNEINRDAANMKMLVWSCKEFPEGATWTWWPFWRDCKPDDDPKVVAVAKDDPKVVVVAKDDPKVVVAAKDDPKVGTPPTDDKKVDTPPVDDKKGGTTPMDAKKGDAATSADKKGGTPPAADKKGGAAAKGDKKDDTTTAKKPPQYVDAWVEVPWTLNVWVYLTLGGLLIGLGSPFWYDAVTGLTNLRSAVGGATGSNTQSQAAAPAAAVKPAAPVVDKAQPATPVGAFQVSNAARKT
jgi:chemotaxis protein histidine kinase CheA